jgi:hypothetical protein
MKYSKLLTYTALTASMYAATANAAFVPLPVGTVVLEDDNLEYVLTQSANDENGDGLTNELDYIIKETGFLLAGDRLRSMITFQTAGGGSLGAPGLEVTGISEIEIVSIDATLFGPLITFKPSASFEAVYGTGAMAALYSQASGDWPVTTDACSALGVAGCETVSTNGELWLVAGIGDDDDYWTSTVTAVEGFNIDAVRALGAGTSVGTAAYALTILENNTGYEFAQQELTGSFIQSPTADDNLVDLIGSGQLQGGAGLTGPFFARSDFDFQLKRIPVPEPSTLAIFGLGLLGMGFRARRIVE